MHFHVYTQDVARPCHQTRQGMQLIADRQGEAFLQEASQIVERNLKQAVKFPQFFCGSQHIGNLKSLRKFLSNWQPPKRKTRDVPAREVTSVELRRAWTGLSSGIVIHMLGKKYWVTQESGIMRIIRETQTERVQERSDRVDCDSPATRFAAAANRYGINTVAIVFDVQGRCSYNVVFFDDDKGDVAARAFEPQTDMFVKIGHGKYSGQAGVALMV